MLLFGRLKSIIHVISVHSMKKLSIPGILFLLLCVLGSCTSQNNLSNATTVGPEAEQKLLSLSRKKWRWMADKNVDTLASLFHDKAKFVHMGGTMNKEQELGVIKSGGIHYKQADIQEASVQFIGNTAILLNKIRLVAVVGGNDVVNPFMVTEVYVQEGGSWKLGSMSFTRLLTPSAPNQEAAQELLNLSKAKWQWMADKDVDKLAPLFHDKSKFVHMSGTWNKDEELDIIKTGRIWYKRADVHDAVVEVFDDTAILWNRITLQAVVRGEEVSNEFTVTEIYKQQGREWKLLDMTFSSVRDTHSIQR